MPSFYPHLVLLLLLALVGCSLFDGDDPSETEEYFTAVVNGESWEGGTYASLITRAPLEWLTVRGTRFAVAHYPYNESFSFSIAFDGPSPYPIVHRQHDVVDYPTGAMYNESDGDAGIASYYAVDSLRSRLVITAYDSTSGLVEGTFQATVVVDPDDADNRYRRRPDTLHITDGRFRVLVEDHRR